MKKENKRFDVQIKEIKTGKVVSTIGRKMIEERAEKRVLTGLSRIDRDNFFVDIVEKI